MNGSSSGCISIERSVDLSQYADAILSFDYAMRSALNPTADILRTYVSTDGNTYDLLGTLPVQDTDSRIQTYELDAYLGQTVTIRFEICGFTDAGEYVQLELVDVYACDEQVSAGSCASTVVDWEDGTGSGLVWGAHDQQNTYTIATGATPLVMTVNLIDSANRNVDSDSHDAGSHPFDPSGGCLPYPGSTEVDQIAGDGSIVDPWDSDCGPLWTQSNGGYGPGYLTFTSYFEDQEEEVVFEFCFDQLVLIQDFEVSDIDFVGVDFTAQYFSPYEVLGNSFQDKITVWALDGDGNDVPVSIIPVGDNVIVSGQSAKADYASTQNGGLSANDPNGMVLINTESAISCFYLAYSNGEDDAAAEASSPELYSWWSDTHGASNGVSDDQAIRLDGFSACVCQPLAVNMTDAQACYGEPATLKIESISGGVPPYTYNWSDGTVGDSLTIVASSDTAYEVAVITDLQGCEAEATGTITVSPSIDYVAVVVGLCDPTSQSYYIDVTVEYAVGGGDLLIDGTIYPTSGSSPETIRISGLPLGTGITSLDIAFVDDNLACGISAYYLAPDSCCTGNCVDIIVTKN